MQALKENVVVPEYLSDADYNPEKLRVNELMSILSEHGVSLPASRQKKEFYVGLFRDSIMSESKTLLKKMKSVVPS